LFLGDVCYGDKECARHHERERSVVPERLYEMSSEASFEGIEYLPLYLMDGRFKDGIPVGRDFQDPGNQLSDTKKFYRENPFRET
jgi:hypothetical protein